MSDLTSKIHALKQEVHDLKEERRARARKNVHISLRVSEERRCEYDNMAAMNGMTISEWLRSVADAELAR